MKALPIKYNPDDKCYDECSIDEATHIQLNMPGPIPTRFILLKKGHSSKGWEWNRDTEKPTISPSIKTTTYDGDQPDIVCHSFVRNGMVEFCSDCTHELAGQKVELLDVEGEYYWGMHDGERR